MKHIGIVLALLVSACASNQDTRSLAESSGLYVGSLNEGTAAFVEDQNALNAANAAHLARLAEYERKDRAALFRQRVAWTVTGERDRISAFEAGTSIQPETIIAGLDPSDAHQTRIADTTGTNYETAMKRMAELSRRPKPLELFKGALAYLGQVKKSHDKLTDEAAAASKVTVDKTATTDAVASGSSRTVGK